MFDNEMYIERISTENVGLKCFIRLKIEFSLLLTLSFKFTKVHVINVVLFVMCLDYIEDLLKILILKLLLFINDIVPNNSKNKIY